MARLSRFIHSSIVFKLLRASFTKFYNLITSGRIMNRLSKDIYEIDTLIYSDISLLFSSIIRLIIMIIMFSYCFNLRVFPIGVFYLIFSIFISIYFLRAKRQVVRIGKKNIIIFMYKIPYFSFSQRQHLKVQFCRLYQRSSEESLIWETVLIIKQLGINSGRL